MGELRPLLQNAVFSDYALIDKNRYINGYVYNFLKFFILCTWLLYRVCLHSEILHYFNNNATKCKQNLNKVDLSMYAIIKNIYMPTLLQT